MALQMGVRGSSSAEVAAALELFRLFVVPVFVDQMAERPFLLRVFYRSF